MCICGAGYPGILACICRVGVTRPQDRLIYSFCVGVCRAVDVYMRVGASRALDVYMRCGVSRNSGVYMPRRGNPPTGRLDIQFCVGYAGLALQGTTALRHVLWSADGGSLSRGEPERLCRILRNKASRIDCTYGTLGEGNSDFKPDQMEPAQPFQANPSRRRKTPK